MKLGDKIRGGSNFEFTITPSYLRGARQAQECKPAMNPYKPGTALAQYNYGYSNELTGHHDQLDLPFDAIVLDDLTQLYKPGRK